LTPDGEKIGKCNKTEVIWGGWDDGMSTAKQRGNRRKRGGW